VPAERTAIVLIPPPVSGADVAIAHAAGRCP